MARHLRLPQRPSTRRLRGFASSGLPGPKGNRETFVHLGRTGSAPGPGRAQGEVDVEAAIAEVEP